MKTIEVLAMSINHFKQDYDPYGFNDDFDSPEEGFLDVLHGLQDVGGLDYYYEDVRSKVQQLEDDGGEEVETIELGNEILWMIESNASIGAIILEPCPCCTTIPHLMSNRDGGSFSFRCPECGDESFPKMNTIENAAFAWNAGITEEYVEEQLQERASGSEIRYRKLRSEYNALRLRR